MNIAIIVGVSEYSKPGNNLPGCKKDAEIIFNILSKTEKFEDILYVNEYSPSAIIKAQFTDFITKHKEDSIQELFFYYTGHGDFKNDEFYYILSDYEASRRNQTTLQNGEIDSLFKTLSPALVIKVIDACKSGQAYVKDTEAISKYFSETQTRFNNCYFLNSSLRNQSSYQSADISDFTQSFVDSIKARGITEIRYKDIIDYISDAFEGNPYQTPFFVIQAEYTEKFCYINEALNGYLQNLSILTPATAPKNKEEITLLERIQEDAAEYLTKDETIKLLEKIKDDIKKLAVPRKLDEIFTLEVKFFEDYDVVINKDTIGKWLDDNTHQFFARSKTKLLPKNQFGIRSALRFNFTSDVLLDRNDYDVIRDGFDLEVEVPYKSIEITLNSKYPNVDGYTAIIVYLVSQKAIRFFYFITNVVSVNWDVKKINRNINWISSEYSMKDQTSIESEMKTIFQSLLAQVDEDLKEKFPDSKTPSS
ncbi:caspase family protein [Olivibacter domesticus]|uniref:Caspase domain-containing protein n=1 Tax=Olivibacter domesticus TaxID=407022 RepID=A0A1H7KJZ4_OLID1|nr:caspase family protein [Olivibacter domesticus]SEK87108.1 Caspase domain-containing protein [Olivibacter domesticus]